jgi:MoxR-like ATPase
MVKMDCDKLQQELWEQGILLDRRSTMGICAAINTNKNMMFAGLPGTAKTMTAKAVAKALFGGTEEDNFKGHFYRITATPGISRQDFFGDWNYHKQFLEVQRKCTGDEQAGVCVEDIHKKGRNLFSEEFFDEGPAMQAVKTKGGAMLFIDEANRGGEDFQNLVLEVAEEKQVTVPMLGTIKSKVEGMPISVITYNEQDIATEPLSDAFLRRFARIKFHPLKLNDAVRVLEKKEGKSFLPDTDKIVKKVVG